MGYGKLNLKANNTEKQMTRKNVGFTQFKKNLITTLAKFIFMQVNIHINNLDKTPFNVMCV